MNQEMLDTYRFRLILDDEAFIEYLALMLSDDKFSKDELRPLIFQTVIDAVDLYEKKNRNVSLGIYVSTCVKKVVEHYKEDNS